MEMRFYLNMAYLHDTMNLYRVFVNMSSTNENKLKIFRSCSKTVFYSPINQNFLYT